MNRKIVRAGLAAAIAGALGITGAVAAQGGGENQKNHFGASLSGYAETPLALSTPATGAFRLKVDDGAQEIDYVLTFDGVPSAVTQAHIHMGSRSQSGGVSAFLCSNLGNGPAGTQACPVSGTISGTIRPTDVIGPAAQGISAGEFQELVAAIRHRSAYVNVHSTAFPAGEIRGQLR